MGDAAFINFPILAIIYYIIDFIPTLFTRGVTHELPLFDSDKLVISFYCYCLDLSGDDQRKRGSPSLVKAVNVTADSKSREVLQIEVIIGDLHKFLPSSVHLRSPFDHQRRVGGFIG